MVFSACSASLTMSLVTVSENRPHLVTYLMPTMDTSLLNPIVHVLNLISHVTTNVARVLGPQ
jgi:hypothetical protein